MDINQILNKKIKNKYKLIYSISCHVELKKIV